MVGAPAYEGMNNQTSYIAPIKTEALGKTAIFKYDYY